MRTLAATFLLLFALSAQAGELEDFKKDLAVVQAEIRAELANLQAAQDRIAGAQSEIARIKAIGPALQAREKELAEKVQALEKKAAEKKEKAK